MVRWIRLRRKRNRDMASVFFWGIKMNLDITGVLGDCLAKRVLRLLNLFVLLKQRAEIVVCFRINLAVS